MHAPPPNAQAIVDGRYILDAPLDAWGIGEGWRCRDKNFRNRPVVLKFLRGGAEQLGERTQELRTQRTLKHANVLPVINQGVWDGRPWVAFDHFDGASFAHTLEAERRAHGALETGTAREVMDKVFDALGAAHEAAAPVLHGCLQPGSVLVGAAGVKVIDFGLLSFASDIIGPYRAPEVQRATDVSLAGDVYGLGATLADALLPQTLGDPRHALEAFLVALARDGMAAGRAQRPDLPPALWDVIARAVKRDPAMRWDDVSAMRVALDAGRLRVLRSDARDTR